MRVLGSTSHSRRPRTTLHSLQLDPGHPRQVTLSRAGLRLLLQPRLRLDPLQWRCRLWGLPLLLWGGGWRPVAHDGWTARWWM